jgi:pimeloyl-ACP methyl ester carboxylesterase
MASSGIRYAQSSDGLDIAYQVIGDGPVDLVFVSGFVTHLDWSWELPHFAWLEQLDGIARVITFDKRGTGLSERSLGFGSLDERSRDIAAVMDAAGSERAVLCGLSEGAPMSILFAATHPQRVSGLVLLGPLMCGAIVPDHPSGRPQERRQAWLDSYLEFIEAEWGTGSVIGELIQHAPDPEAARRLLARFERNACTPSMAMNITRHNADIDVRPLLSTISVPTLVVHARADPVIHFANGKYIADHIDGAELVALDRDFHASWRPADVAGWRDAVIRFLGAAGAPARPVDRILAAVLFTDIVESTTQANEVGDSAWHNLLDRHDRIVAGEAERFNGRLVKSTGDGALVVLDGPSAGIDCARALVDALRPHGLRIRAGLHVGEVELRGDDVAGLGVVIAARVCEQAGSGQILVTRTVKDLVAGSDIQLTPAGAHQLKGVPDTWQLYEPT